MSAQTKTATIAQVTRGSLGLLVAVLTWAFVYSYTGYAIVVGAAAYWFLGPLFSWITRHGQTQTHLTK